MYRTVLVVLVMSVSFITMCVNTTRARGTKAPLAMRRNLVIEPIDLIKIIPNPCDEIQNKTAHVLEGETPEHVRTREMQQSQIREKEHNYKRQSFAEQQEMIWQKALCDYALWRKRMGDVEHPLEVSWGDCLIAYACLACLLLCAVGGVSYAFGVS
jgi:hypothetical protein